MPVGVTVFSLHPTGELPFQRINSMMLSSILESDGGDTEPRGTAVKGHWSRTQGEGKQEREGGKNNTLICTDLEPCMPV